MIQGPWSAPSNPKTGEQAGRLAHPTARPRRRLEPETTPALIAAWEHYRWATLQSGNAFEQHRNAERADAVVHELLLRVHADADARTFIAGLLHRDERLRTELAKCACDSSEKCANQHPLLPEDPYPTLLD